MSEMGFDKETIEWFEKHPSEQSTVIKCPFCNLFFKPSLGHNCSRKGRRVDQMEAELHSRDEIIRATAEAKKARAIKLNKCCNEVPLEMQYKGSFIYCPICGKRTKEFRALYLAKEAWNKGERNGKNRI